MGASLSLSPKLPSFKCHSQDVGHIHLLSVFLAFPGHASGKKPTCQSRILKRCEFNPWVGKMSWRRAWQPTLVFLPGESHGQRSLVGYSPWGRKESHTTERLTFCFSMLLCVCFSYCDFPFLRDSCFFSM